MRFKPDIIAGFPHRSRASLRRPQCLSLRVRSNTPRQGDSSPLVLTASGRSLFAELPSPHGRLSRGALVRPWRHSLFVSKVEPIFRLTDVLRSGYSLNSGDHFKPRLRNFSDGPFTGKEIRACRHLSQASAQTKCSPARKLRAVFS